MFSKEEGTGQCQLMSNGGGGSQMLQLTIIIILYYILFSSSYFYHLPPLPFYGSKIPIEFLELIIRRLELTLGEVKVELDSVCLGEWRASVWRARHHHMRGEGRGGRDAMLATRADSTRKTPLPIHLPPEMEMKNEQNQNLRFSMRGLSAAAALLLMIFH